MRLIANENFQFQGIHRAGATLTVSKNMLKTEIEKGYHPVEIKGHKRFISGLIEHCTPANEETDDYINSVLDGSLKDDIIDDQKTDKTEPDNSKEIRDIRAEFDLMGKAYHPKWQLKRLKTEIIKARKAVGDLQKEKEQKETLIKD